MKSLLKQSIGGDGATIELALDGGKLLLAAAYPIDKLASPLTALIDSAIDAAEKAIPGDWDRAVLEPIRIAAKAEVIKLLSE